MYSAEFAADPHAAYRQMRDQFGSLVPVELAPGVPATLVVGYQAALQILNDPEHFPADPRTWQRNIPADCPVLPMMEWRPNPIRSAGQDHTRYRSAVSSALAKVDLHRLHATVEQIAVPLINSFCETGEADVLGQYAQPLIFAALSAMLGVTPEIGQRASEGMAAIFGMVDAAAGNAMLGAALQDLVQLKRATPGEDVTSWLIQHPVGLSDEEMMQQLVLLYGAGLEPPQHLITNSLLLMLTDDRFAATVLDGSLSTRDALDEVLFNDPPMANFCISYPRQPILVDRMWLPAHQPVVVSMAACNNDPAIRRGEILDNRSHLAFSAGPHACPARSPATLIVQDAIDQLLDALPELELAVPVSKLEWRPDPFYRALVSLPVRFPPSPPIGTVGF
ncbi:cytochrome P450 [Nocardia callitridis]|uniref:Cytochrome P450 n=1 Tax=Nocardia callitridis TaxID=648753 RepID=A0ABP9K7D6_9NOCA